MKARRLWPLVPALLLASGAEPARADRQDDGTDEIRAFIAETREKADSSRVEEIELEQRRLDRALTARGRAYVRLVRSGLLPLSDGYELMLSHLGRAERLRHALAHDLARKARLDRERRELEAGVNELRRRREQLAQNVAEYERSRDAILAARDREAAFRRAFVAEMAPSTAAGVAVYSGRPETERFASFSAAKGRLPLPVQGRAEIRPVRLPDALGPGAFLAVEDGSIVTAVLSGRVILTGEYGELGRSVVIDHGEGYTTLSAQLGVITVEVGDQLGAGDSIGTLADRAQGNLYFEIRHSGVAVEPGAWFGL